MKKTLSTLLVITLSFTSCSRNDNFETSESKINLKKTNLDLQSIHSSIKGEFSLKKHFEKNTSFHQNTDEIEKKFNENLQYAYSNGVEGLFEKNNLNVEWISAVEYVISNMENTDVYDNIEEMNIIHNENEARLFFAFVETYVEYEKIKSGVSRRKNNSIYYEQGLPSGCGRAVVGSILTTAVFAGVTAASGGFGAAAAIGFLASKSWATYNIISACSA
ncbi:hypothetical protein D1001_08305 [Riemerella anatipestifer]|uniref:hypothetical protein n=1 Tax=Riemerella anatipestifer TaxID=34085 RepID=UPI00129D3B98|nr:hypothetical protein [Riemerella anatipestifer]MRN03286.1 hypothetical protein [Riemerella anatipestifer]